MNGKSHEPKYVVTILRDQQPIAVFEQQRTTDNSSSTEGFYRDLDVLNESREVLAQIANSVGYLLWKETGVLPAPLDYIPPDDPTGFPF